MKRLIRRTVLTNNRKSGERGGITLETALVMPVFLLLVFFLLFLVKTSITSMALHGAVTQTVRMAASAWYPISLLEPNAQPESSPSSGDRLNGVRETVGDFAAWLPAPLNGWAADIANGSWTLDNQAAKLAFRQLALQWTDSRVLNPDHFTITSVELPTGGDPAKAYLTIEAEYRLPFRVPFTGRQLFIRASARERAWVGGTPSKAGSADAGSGKMNISFVSLEPNPVRPGRTATLVLRTAPGTRLDLSVLYKSGQSQAKHLGSAVADESGVISWTWLVSGNTTPGVWNWEVKDGQGASRQQSFQVVSTHGERQGSP